ncbi:MAG: metal-dependent hydrolase, partial [Parvibaculum sp.]|nr:metal-dependent hydrolase [Parvibaculum sp.]
MHGSSLSRTPENVEIVPRNRQFNIDETLATNWHSNDPFRTAFFDAMSILFPLGEQFFIDSVKAFRDRIDDPELQRRIRGFTAQESVH